jgi:hypothetical protein
MGRYVSYNANPLRNIVGDCVIRTISKAEGKSWDEIYTAVCLEGAYLGDMPTANAVWGSYLRRIGYKRTPIEDKGKEYYTVADFCADNPQGVYILAMESHVVAVCDGRYFDTWDCGNEPPLYSWKKENKEEKK